MIYIEEFELAKRIIIEVGSFLLLQEEINIESEECKDIKLELDRISEKKIVEGLKNFGYNILSEEMGLLDYNSNMIWIIDPIDGTLNYSRGNPSNCISIALYNNSKPLFGLIYDFNRNELFSGYVGVGAWINDKKIINSDKKVIAQSILATGFPTYFEHDKIFLEQFISKVQNYKKIRMIGSAALSLAYVACNRFDTYIEQNIKLWDVAAGIAINTALRKEIQIIEKDNYLLDVNVGNFNE